MNKDIKYLVERLFDDGILDTDELTLDELNIEDNIAPYKLVDLGLPSGTLWMDRNIGAKHPEDVGNYYAWGEIEPKNVYTRKNYKVDNLKDFLDVVSIKTDGTCRMFNSDEMHELINNTIVEFTTYNNVSGLKCMSKINDNFIFIPISGKLCNETIYSSDTVQLWSSDSLSNTLAYLLYATSSYPKYILKPPTIPRFDVHNMFLGCPVRGVMVPN